MCAGILAILVFFFQTGIGQSFLMYPYTESFKLRFPMAFVAFFLMSFFLETVKSNIMTALNDLKDSQELTISNQTSELREQNFELLRAKTKLEAQQHDIEESLKNI